MSREMVDVNKNKYLTQGSIFNCAKVDDYLGDEVLGLIITARCDIENNKVSNFNYLPLIPFNIWKDNDLVNIVKVKNLKSLEGELKAKVKPKFSEGNIDAYGLDAVVKKFMEELKENNKNKELKVMEKLYSKLKSIQESCTILELNEFFEKDIINVMKEIAENKNSNYFLIDKVMGYGAAVLNLREVLVISKVVGLKLADGVESSDCLNELELGNLDGSLATIVGELKSPYIELVLQRFSNNFTRIGVENHSEKLITDIFK